MAELIVGVRSDPPAFLGAHLVLDFRDKGIDLGILVNRWAKIGLTQNGL